MKALLAIYAFGLCSYSAAAPSQNLGLLANYYQDCPGRDGKRAAELRRVIRRALAGDHAAMRRVIAHKGLFSTGDNEAFTDVPQALLRTVGDDRYSAFVRRQSHQMQELALALYPEQIPAFARRFPKTAKLYHDRFSR